MLYVWDRKDGGRLDSGRMYVPVSRRPRLARPPCEWLVYSIEQRSGFRQYGAGRVPLTALEVAAMRIFLAEYT